MLTYFCFIIIFGIFYLFIKSSLNFSFVLIDFLNQLVYKVIVQIKHFFTVFIVLLLKILNLLLILLLNQYLLLLEITLIGFPFLFMILLLQFELLFYILCLFFSLGLMLGIHIFYFFVPLFLLVLPLLFSSFSIDYLLLFKGVLNDSNLVGEYCFLFLHFLGMLLIQLLNCLSVVLIIVLYFFEKCLYLKIKFLHLFLTLLLFT